MSLKLIEYKQLFDRYKGLVQHQTDLFKEKNPHDKGPYTLKIDLEGVLTDNTVPTHVVFGSHTVHADSLDKLLTKAEEDFPHKYLDTTPFDCLGVNVQVSSKTDKKGQGFGITASFELEDF